MIDCKEATRRIEQMQEAELSFFHRLSLHMHLRLCKYCHRFYRQWNWLALNLKRDPKVILDEEYNEKMKSSINKFS